MGIEDITSEDVLSVLENSKLEKKYAEVLKLRAGYYGMPLSLKTTGAVIGLCQERIRQLEESGVLRFRRLANRAGLLDLSPNSGSVRNFDLKVLLSKIYAKCNLGENFVREYPRVSEFYLGSYDKNRKSKVQQALDLETGKSRFYRKEK